LGFLGRQLGLEEPSDTGAHSHIVASNGSLDKSEMRFVETVTVNRELMSTSNFLYAPRDLAWFNH